MEATTREFKSNAFAARRNPQLQSALAKLGVGFPLKRLEAAARLPEFEDLRDRARAIKDHVLDNLDYYLERFEERVTEQGGSVHWCADAEAARAKILEICKAAGASKVKLKRDNITQNETVRAAKDFRKSTGAVCFLGNQSLRTKPNQSCIALFVYMIIVF